MMRGFVSLCVLNQFAVNAPYTVNDPDYFA